MNLQEYWFPIAITNTTSLLLILICFKWPKIGKTAWGIIFILAGIFNIYTGYSNPQAYISYGVHAVGLYKQFINGLFSSYTAQIVSVIALGQILVGIFLLLKKKFLLLGVIGGIIFLVAISPLGIGSAFPSTLLMSFSLVLLLKRINKESADHSA